LQRKHFQDYLEFFMVCPWANHWARYTKFCGILL